MASYPAYGGQQQQGGLYPYPPNSNKFGSSSTTFKTAEDDRRISRTPSPTPSEAEELAKPSLFDWRTYINWRFWIRREWLWYYVILGVILICTILISVYHDQIVDALTPATKWMHDLPAGWLIPIAILFVISFPPLFGHEIVAILCGLVWGLWVGFAIVSAGTVIGEVGNFYAFKYCCRARGEKMERTNIMYACLARVVREGGFKIALVARYSAIPGHFTTAIFSTCGMGIFTFLIAAVLSCPKQFITVYLGVILEESGTGKKDTKNTIISDSVLAITVIVTFLALWYMLREMNKVKVDVIYQRRKARQEKISRGAFNPYSSGGFTSGSSVGFNPQASETDMPYGLDGQTSYQKWDKEGHAIGYAGDPRLQAPQPQRASTSGHPRVPTFRTAGGGAYDTRGNPYPRDEEDVPGVTYPAGQGGRSPIRQDSEESDSWHGHQSPNSFHLPRVPRVASPPGLSPKHTQPPTDPFASVETVHQTAYVPPIPPPPSSAGRASASASTPTQAQFVNAPPPSGAVMSPPLPMPNFPGSPSGTPTQGAMPNPHAYYSHGAEATDATYRTAMSSPSHSREGTEQDMHVPPRTAFSPPPPSYHTSAPGR